jgi:hypothetical protein
MVVEVSRIFTAKTSIMTFEIPFNAAVTTAQYELRFRRAWREYRRTIFYLLFVGIFATLVGVLGATVKDAVGYCFLGAGLYILLTTAGYFRHYWKKKGQYRQYAKRIVDRRVKDQEITVYEFNDDYFRCKDILYDSKIAWAAFKGYEIAERNLFLKLAESLDERSFILLGEDEFGTEKFKEVIDFMRSKMGAERLG